MKRNLLIMLVGLIALFCLGDARGETANFDPFSSTPIVSNPNASGPNNVQPLNGGSGNSMADGIASTMLTNDTSDIQYSDQAAADNSRKNAAATAGSSSGKGQGLHAAIGSSMIATAIPMLASPIAAVRAAGAALMGMGITELAQSGADGGVKDKNNAQRDLLTEKANQDGKQATPSTAQQVANNPELNKMLSDKGVNPEDFANKAANGELNNPEDMLKAVGDTGEYSADDLAKGAEMAQSEMNNIFRENDPIQTKLGYDENNPITAANGSGRGITGKGDDSLDKALNDAGKASGTGSAQNWAKNNTKPGGDAGGKGDSSAADSAKNLLASLLGGGEGAAGIASQLAFVALQKIGIIKIRGKGNIFQIAHRSYRSWGKWRKKFLRLAATN